MEIHLLKEFLQLAKMLNYTAAADALFMSRPTLSKHIKQLEGELGVELFERSTKSVRLTRQGAILKERAYNIMREYETALIELDSSRTVQGTLRIAGCSRFPVINQAMYEKVSAFERAYRDVDITIDDIFARDFREELMDGTYDLVCSMRLPGLNEEGLECIPLREMDVCAWVPPNSELASRDSVTLEELSKYVVRYMQPKRSRLLTSYYRAMFEQAGLSVRVGKPLTPTIFMAEDEFCLFPYVEGPSELLPNVVQVPIVNPAKLPVCWIRKRKNANPVTALFVDMIEEAPVSGQD